MKKTKPLKSGTHTLFGWSIAIAGSILLNVSLFGLMPGLIQRLPASQGKLEEIKHLQVIRVKRVEAPPRKKEPPKVIKPKPLKKIKQSQMTQAKQKPVTHKPRLAFELNPKLPSAPMDLVMPTLENFSMDVPVLKDLYSIAELDSGLMALVKIAPLYPIRAKRRGIEGFVSLEFFVTKKGLVEQIKIIQSVPENIFDKSVMNCVSMWKFKPGTVEGIPVATRAKTTIHFKLE